MAAGKMPHAPPSDGLPSNGTLDACRRCPLGARATQSVPGDGPRRSRLMLVGARVVATYHPSAVLRAFDAESRARLYAALVDDLRRAAALLESN